jgi:mRNA interferase MazF
VVGRVGRTPRLGAGLPAPVVVVQGDSLNRSHIATVVCVAVTSNLKWAFAPGNVLLPVGLSGLPNDSVANVSQIVTLDRSVFSEHVASLPETLVQLVLRGSMSFSDADPLPSPIVAVCWAMATTPSRKAPSQTPLGCRILRLLASSRNMYALGAF